jgi:hypothetical protein
MAFGFTLMRTSLLYKRGRKFVEMNLPVRALMLNQGISRPEVHKNATWDLTA